MPFTIIRPNFYLHNVTAGWAPTLDPQGNYYAPAGDARISMVDARDVAVAAAEALTTAATSGVTYDVTGPEALSHAEACEKLGERLGRPVRYVAVDDDTARGAMLGAGLNQWLTDALIELYQDYRRSGPDPHGTASERSPGHQDSLASADDGHQAGNPGSSQGTGGRPGPGQRRSRHSPRQAPRRTGPGRKYPHDCRPASARPPPLPATPGRATTSAERRNSQAGERRYAVIP